MSKISKICARIVEMLPKQINRIAAHCTSCCKWPNVEEMAVPARDIKPARVPKTEMKTIKLNPAVISKI